MSALKQWNQPLSAVNRCPCNYHFPSAQQLTSITKGLGIWFWLHSSIQSRSKCTIFTISGLLFCRQLKLNNTETTSPCFWFIRFFQYCSSSGFIQPRSHPGLILQSPFSNLIISNFIATLSLLISLLNFHLFPYYSFLLNVIWICHRETRRQPTTGFAVCA